MLMKRIAAYRFLILVLALSAVLSLPGGLLAAVGTPASGCSHCQGASAGLVAGCCCCQPDMPGHCGASGQGGGATCRCTSGSGPASISPAVTGLPTWQASTHVFAMVTVSSKTTPLNIFHPPKFQISV
jgi:hypothetical protein